MNDAPDDRLPPGLRWLKGLVITLAATMIAGLVILIGLLVTRLPPRTALPPLPESIVLPDGAVPEVFTRGRGWLGVVTEDGRLLVYDAGTGELRQEVRVETGAPAR
ncbi:MAG: hypothetical protein H5U20_12980 [Rhodobacteraceae bacterium]|nr:hypothetical protein [Paracoccaceae bacterium]